MTNRKVFFDTLTKRIDETLKSKKSRDDKLKTVCKLLKENVPHYNWVGFYLTDKKKPNELVLGPFEGEPTEHIRIAFGKGICGQAAKLEKTFLAQDVSRETNYLSCNANVKSEIVLPIFKNRRIAGELDIDSHALSPFTKEDETFLKKIADMTSEIL
jgi:L-methionine (R)-S-oxide reductase